MSLVNPASAKSNGDIERLRERISKAWDTETFRDAGQTIISELAEHLEKTQAGQGAVLPWKEPSEMISLASKYLEREASCTNELVSELTKTFLEHSQKLHHPAYIGHQVPASAPIAGLFDALGAVTNQVMGIYEMGPFTTAVERSVIDKLAELIGWDPHSCSGVVTHGGSLANLTALLTARNVQFPEMWASGVAGGKHDSSSKIRIIANADSHYCIHRAAGILGLGTDSVLSAPINRYRKIDTKALDTTLSKLLAEGHKVLAVAASACTTPTGAFDDLDAVADVCEKHGVWLHVDAAHGGGALMSPSHQQKLAGLHRADSIVWDAHKMMFVPALCAFVFFKQREHGFAPFQQKAPYLFDAEDTSTLEYDSAVRTLECTKRAAAMGVWSLWSLFGKQLFADLVDLTFGMTQQFRELLLQDGSFEVPYAPEANILIFRLTKSSGKKLSPAEFNSLHASIRRRLVRSGTFYITQTELDNKIWLRVTIMNPLTSQKELEGLIAEIKRVENQIATDQG